MKLCKLSLIVVGLCALLMISSAPVMAEDSASAEIDKRAQDPNQWPAPGRDNLLTRFSPLKDINTGNIKKLEGSARKQVCV